MPPVKVLYVQWDANTTYATKRATVAEIEGVFANVPWYRPTCMVGWRPISRSDPRTPAAS